MADARLELLADSSQIRTAKKDLDALNATGANVERTQKGMQSAVKQTGVNMGDFSRKAGAAGIQIQQFTGQVTTGTNSLVALSQQAADLGIVLGAPLVGVLASLGATALLMASNTEEASNALTQLDDIAETVGKTLEQAADGSDIFSESIQRLANRSEALARVQIAQTIADLNQQIATSARGIKEAVSEFGGIRLDVGIVDTLQELGLQLEDVPRLFGDISEEVDTLGAGGVLQVRGLTERIDLLAKSLGISREQAVSLQVAIDDFAQDQSATGIATLRSEIESLTTAVGADNEKVTKLASSLLTFFESSREGVDRVNLLRQALTDLDKTLEENSGESDKAAKSNVSLTTSLQAQIIALQGGAQAAEVYAATQAAIANGTEAQLPKIIELINQKYELKRAQEAAAESAKLEIEQQKAYESVLDSIFKNQERIKTQKLRESEQRQASFESLRQQIVLQQAQLQLDNDQYELRRNLLALGDGANQSQIDEITALTEQMQQLRFEAELLGPTLENSLQTIGLNAMDSLSQGLANVITEGESLRDVLGGVANTILNELLTAVIRYAIGAAAQSVIGQSIATTAAVTSAATIAAAATPAAIAMNIATLGGAATAAAATSAAAIPTMAGLISGSALAGFEKGGYTGNYGTKEVAGVVHGQEFVMNAKATRQNRGTLEAMNKGESIGGNTYVNVTNNATNSDVSTEESTDSQGNRVIDIVVNNINQRGKIHRAMTQTTTAGNRI